MRATAVTVAIAVSAPAAYLALLTTAGLTRWWRIGRTTATQDSTEPQLRFAVLVPAHNEAAVITESVRSLVLQDYPSELIDVLVVADNCTDETPELARAAGATVFIRDDAKLPGKAHALNWLVDQLDGMAYDVAVIVDADSLVDHGFVKAIHQAIEGGAQVCQGYYGVLHPEQSSTVALRLAALASKHLLRPLGRSAMALSCGLYGNGMAFRWEVLATRRWSDHLAEDAMLQAELLLDGIVVQFVPDALLAAEIPNELSRSVTQHERWELGTRQVARRMLPQLTHLILSGGPLPRRYYLDAAADHLVPPISAIAFFNVIGIAVGTITTVVKRPHRFSLVLVASLGSSLVLAVHVVSALIVARAPRSAYMALIGAPKLVLWKIGLLARIAVNPQEISWQRTSRNDVPPISRPGDP